MKRYLLTTFVALLSGVILLNVEGCASTQTSESTGQYLDDSVMTTKVKSALLQSKDVNSSHVSVTTYKGIVQLSGFVNSSDQVLKAGQIASKVGGVVKVENDLIVK